MARYRALLIGVSQYDSNAFQNLDFIADDFMTLQASLESSNYNVRVEGAGGETVSPSRIRNWIRDFCKESKKDDTLLICFSGHGLHYKGKDYLVPSDAIADFDDPDSFKESLVPVDFEREFEKSQASTILFFVDACREGSNLIPRVVRFYNHGAKAIYERSKIAR